VYEIFERVFERLKATVISEEEPEFKYKFEVHHLTIMSNHYHMMVSVSEETPIDRLMQQVNSRVATAVNRLLGRRGHLWEGRYKSRILDSVEYIKRTIAYIYHNPVKAKITKKILEYTASTLRLYWEGELPKWLEPDPFLKESPAGKWAVILKELVLDKVDPLFNLAK